MESGDWRYERKFRVEQLDRATLEAWLWQHPAGFRRAFPNRQVNNIYYDTPELRCFAENMAGINQRSKYRIRWYGPQSQQIDSPVLEIKMKHNELGAKQSEKLSNFSLSALPKLRDRSQLVKDSQEAWLPALCNRYHRSYFISADGRYRLTIDDQLSFQSPDHAKVQSPTWHQIADVVLELKYAQADDESVAEITRFIPFRQTKNSKYAMGVLLVN